MFIQDWIYFEKVARCGSISSAAEELYRTYQGIHKSISRLESELGHELFMRDGNTLTLTPFGKYMLEHMVVPLLDYWAEINRGGENFEEYRSGILNIGLFERPSALCSGILLVIEKYQALHPDVQFNIVTQSPSHNYKKLLSEELDLAFCVSPFFDDRFASAVTMDAQVFCYGKDDSAFGSRSSISLKELKDIPIGVLKRSAASIKAIIDNSSEINPENVVYFNSDLSAQTIFASGSIVILSPLVQSEPLANSVLLTLDPPLRYRTGFYYIKKPSPKNFCWTF